MLPQCLHFVAITIPPPRIIPHIAHHRNGKLHILCMIDGMNAASIFETAQ